MLAVVVAATVWAHPSAAQTPAPAAPTGLAYTASHEAVTLTWDSPGDSSITGYQVLRRGRASGSVLAVHVDDTMSDLATYVDSDVEAGGQYVYRVKARNSQGLSLQSEPLDVDVPTAPPKPRSASISGKILTLTYGSELDEGSVPEPSDFSVTAAGSDRGIEDVDIIDEFVRLTLSAPVQAGTTVTVDYTVPDANPVRENQGKRSVAGLDGHAVDYTGHIYTQLATASSDVEVRGVWSDGDTMWVGVVTTSGSRRRHYLRAYDLSTGTRDSSFVAGMDIELTHSGSEPPRIVGVWSDGEYVWVADIYSYPRIGRRAFAYRMNPGGSNHGNRARSRDIRLAKAKGEPYGNRLPGGIWSDGETMWVVDNGTDSSVSYAMQMWAYRMNPGGLGHGQVERDKEFLLHGHIQEGHTEPAGVWSDGETMWVIDERTCGFLHASEQCHVYAYVVNPGAEDHGRRVPSREFTLDMRRHPSTISSGTGATGTWIQDPVDLWSDGTTLWVIDGGGAPQVYGYPIPLYVKSATVDGSTVTLTYNDSLHTLSEPVASAFTVLVEGAARTVSDVEIDGKDVVLSLASAAAFGETVTVSYAPPTTSPLRSEGGYLRQPVTGSAEWATNLADAFSGQRVANLASAEVTVSSALSTTSLGGMWSDGDDLWVVERESNKLLSYSLATGSAGSAMTLDAANTDPTGIWSDGDKVWVADGGDDKVYAYDSAGGAVPSEEITTLVSAGNTDARGIWSDGTVMWVVDRADRKAYAYLLDDGSRLADRDFFFDADNGSAYGAWSDGATLWVADTVDAKLYAYSFVGSAHAGNGRRKLTSGVRVPGWDVALPAGTRPTGLWSRGGAVWVGDNQTGTVGAYPIKGASIAPRFAQGRDPRDPRYSLNAGPLDAHTFSVPTGTPVGTDIGYPVTAVSSIGSTLTYTVGGGDSSKFSIDPSSGQIQNTEILEFSDGAQYTVTVTVTDAAGRSDKSKVRVVTSSPVVSSIVAVDDEVTLTYNMELDEDSVPDASNFTVSVSGSDREATHVDVDGKKATLTLSAAVWPFDTLTLTYTAPDTDPLSAESSDGGPARSFNGRTVTNRTTVEIAATGDRVIEGLWSDGDTLWAATRTGFYEGFTSDGYILAIDKENRVLDDTKHIDLQDGSSNRYAVGLWSDGTTLWVSDMHASKLLAYSRATGARDSSRDIGLDGANSLPTGIWSDGETVWVANSSIGGPFKLFAYDLHSGARSGSRDITLDAGNTSPRGIWSDGVTIWVANMFPGRVYAYSLAGRQRDSGKDISLSGQFPWGRWSQQPWGIWSDGSILWTSHSSGAPNYVTTHPMRHAVTVPTYVFDSTTRRFEEDPDGVVNVGWPVQAVDANADVLTYAIGGQDAGEFDFDAATGQIRTKADKTYDYETKSSYEVIVTATEPRGASDTVAVTIDLIDVIKPSAAPDKPTFSDIGLSSLQAEWTEPSDTGDNPITDYNVYYRVMSAPEWTDAGHDGTATSAVLSGLPRGTSFQVQVQAVSLSGESPWSTPGTVSTLPNIAPEFPSSTEAAFRFDENTGPNEDVGSPVAATDANDDALAYSLSGSDAAFFEIHRDTGQIRTKAGETYDHQTKASYSVTVIAEDGHGGTNQITVLIEVNNVNEAPETDDLPERSGAESQNQLSVPGVPSGLVASQLVARSGHSITLSWDDPGDASVSGYRIWRRDVRVDAPGVFSLLVADTGDAGLSLVDWTVAPGGVRYAYRIEALNEAGASGRSRYAAAATVAVPAQSVPGRVVGLRVTASGPGGVSLVWDALEDMTLSGYRVWRGSGGGALSVLVDSTESWAGAFVDATAVDGVRYRYEVAALNAVGTGPVSGVVEVAAGEPLALTAAFESASRNADGTVVLRLVFSEPLRGGFSYRSLRDHGLDVAGAAVKRAKRVEGRNDVWDVTIAPSAADVSVALRVQDGCEGAHALCAGGDRALANTPTVDIANATSAQPVYTINNPAPAAQN